MESSACKIVGHVEYNGEAPRPIGVQVPSYSPLRNPEFRQSAVSSVILVPPLCVCSILSLRRASQIYNHLRLAFWSPPLLSSKLSWVLNRSSFVLRSSLSLSKQVPSLPTVFLPQPPSRALSSGLSPSFFIFPSRCRTTLEALSLSLYSRIQRCRGLFYEFS